MGRLTGEKIAAEALTEPRGGSDFFGTTTEARREGDHYLRDTRLIMIWTGTNEVMDLIIQHEYYQEILPGHPDVRDVEPDAPESEQLDEKVYE